MAGVWRRYVLRDRRLENQSTPADCSETETSEDETNGGFQDTDSGEDISDDCDLYSCSICFEDMSGGTARLLKCGHTFCEVCLNRLASETNFITCPNCREYTRVTSERGLPANFMLSQMKDREKKLKNYVRSVCQICLHREKLRKAVCKCNECQRFLCGRCKSIHRETEVFQDHTFTDIRQFSNDFNACSNHKLPKKYVCVKCIRRMCSDCTFDKTHKNHKDKIKDIATGSVLMKQEIAEFTSCLENLDREVKERMCLEEQQGKKNSILFWLNVKSANVKPFKDMLNKIQLQWGDLKYIDARDNGFVELYADVKSVTKRTIRECKSMLRTPLLAHHDPVSSYITVILVLVFAFILFLFLF